MSIRSLVSSWKRGRDFDSEKRYNDQGDLLEADIHMEDDRKSVSDGKSKTIRYCVLYLSPKDYHRFHAPVDFEIQTGRHFAGDVLPVNPWL